MDDGTIAELAALLATALASLAAFPQVRRVVRHGDGRGVSITSATLGIGSEAAWVGYASQAGLWSALPEAVLMGVANTVLVVGLGAPGHRRGEPYRPAWRGSARWPRSPRSADRAPSASCSA